MERKTSFVRYKLMVLNFAASFIEDCRAENETDEDIWANLQAYLGATDEEIKEIKSILG